MTQEMRETIEAVEALLPKGWRTYIGPGAGGHTEHGITIEPVSPHDPRYLILRFGRELWICGPPGAEIGPTGRRNPTVIEKKGHFSGKGWRAHLAEAVRQGIEWLDEQYPFHKGYSCSGCAAHNVKLWREVGFNVNLNCAICLGASVDEDGRHICDMTGEKTDTIGWWVPAVPAEEGTFWAYTMVPDQQIEWWKRLPSYDPTQRGEAE